jgi:hypothetical protein
VGKIVFRGDFVEQTAGQSSKKSFDYPLVMLIDSPRSSAASFF